MLSGEAAERVLDRVLRKQRWGREERLCAAETIFGVGLWRRTLRVLVGNPEASPRELMFALVVALGGRSREDAQRILSVAPGLSGTPGSLADRWSLPDWLAEHFTRLAGDEADALCAALAVPGPVFLRANTLRISRDALAERLAHEGVLTRPTRFSPVGLEVVGPKPNIFGLASQREGLFEVQDEGSQLLGVLLDAQPGERVLDLCAGAGGKTLQLAAQLKNEGTLDAYDVDIERLLRLRTRAERAGVTCVRITDRVADQPTYNRVLVDAPCSELGTLRRGPDLRWRLNPEVLWRDPPVQRALLFQAARALKPLGRIVYATCTLNPRENESRVLDFLEAHRDFSLVRPSVDDTLLDASGFFRAWPHRHNTDGFFAAVLQRGEG